SGRVEWRWWGVVMCATSFRGAGCPDSASVAGSLSTNLASHLALSTTHSRQRVAVLTILPPIHWARQMQRSGGRVYRPEPARTTVRYVFEGMTRLDCELSSAPVIG